MGSKNPHKEVKRPKVKGYIRVLDSKAEYSDKEISIEEMRGHVEYVEGKCERSVWFCRNEEKGPKE